MNPALKKKSVWLLLASFLVLAWAAQTTYRALSNQSEEDAYKILQEGDTFPANMPLQKAEGGFANFEAYSGKVVLINFWASWCGPCLTEMPSLYALHKKYEPRGLAVIGVTMDNRNPNAVAVLKRVAGEPPFPLFNGEEQAVANRFPIEGLPYTVIVDRNGTIQYAKPGERNWMAAEATQIIEGML